MLQLTCLIVHDNRASVAVPAFVKPQHLMEKLSNGELVKLHGGEAAFADGSLESDLPLAQLSELFGSSFFFVSQCNPHILPFFYSHRGTYMCVYARMPF